MKPDKKKADKSKSQENPQKQLTTDGVGRVLLPGGDGMTNNPAQIGRANTQGTAEGSAGSMLKWLPTKHLLQPNDEQKPKPVKMQRRQDSFAYRAPRMMEKGK